MIKFTEEKFEELKNTIENNEESKDIKYFGTFYEKKRDFDVWLKNTNFEKRLIIESDIFDEENQKAEYSCTITINHIALEDGYESFKIFICDMIHETLTPCANSKEKINFLCLI